MGLSGLTGYVTMLLYLSILMRPKKNISVVRVTCQKKLGRVGREIFFFLEFFLY